MNVIAVGDSRVVEEHLSNLAEHTAGLIALGRIPGNDELVREVLHCGAHIAVVDIAATGRKGLDAVYRLRVGIPDLNIASCRPA